jgi:amino acid transporter
VLAAFDVRWWLLLHLVGVFAFLLSHGVSVTVAFRIRKERDRVKIKDLISLSGSSVRLMYVSLVLLLAGAFAMTFQLHLWGAAWIRISLGLLIVTIIFMIGMASPYYKRLSEAVELRPSGVPRKSDEELEVILKSPVPMIVAGVGFFSLFVILYMMVFQKPA